MKNIIQAKFWAHFCMWNEYLVAPLLEFPFAEAKGEIKGKPISILNQEYIRGNSRPFFQNCFYWSVFRKRSLTESVRRRNYEHLPHLLNFNWKENTWTVYVYHFYDLWKLWNTLCFTYYVYANYYTHSRNITTIYSKLKWIWFIFSSQYDHVSSDEQ